MSEDERMDRARRIKQRREERRTDADEATTEDDGGEADTDATLDDAVADAVERVSRAAASVPSPEEMAGDDSGSGTAAPVTGSEDVGGDTGASGDGPDDSGPADAGTTDAGEADDGETDANATETAEPDERHGLAAEATHSHRTTADTRVLEFTLGEEQYCVDIEYVEEIVTDEPITRVPNTPEFVEGVVDLRGQITTIINPKLLIETEESTPGTVIVVFDADAFDDQGYLGWIVDDVNQVAPVTAEVVKEPPVAEDYVNGVIDRGDDEPFVVWTAPDEALELASSSPP